MILDRCELAIREAEISDLDAIGELWDQLFSLHAELDPIFTPGRNGKHHYLKWVEFHLSDNDSVVLVAENMGKVIGYILAQIQSLPPVLKNCSIGSISDMSIDEQMRNITIGRRLYAEMEYRLIQKGVDRIEVKTSSRNPQSNHFWEQVCGFEEFVRVRYKEVK